MKNLHAQSPKKYPIELMCRLFGVSKQAYHKQKGQSAARKAAIEAFALEYIRSIRKTAPGIGGMKLWYMYRCEFPDRERLGRDRFEDLIMRHGLNVRKRMRKPRTTDSTHGLPVYPNLVRSFLPERVNRLWVSDITYIKVWLSESCYTFAYLSLITDAYSHEIVGWAVGKTLETCYASEALTMALHRLDGKGEENVSGLIHHSDRGVQYASDEYVSLLHENNICISMTENGDPKENAIAERVNQTVKNELLKDIRFHSLAEIKDALKVAVEFYNTRRPHMSVDMMTPEEAARCNGGIRKWWHSYREDAIKKQTA